MVCSLMLHFDQHRTYIDRHSGTFAILIRFKMFNGKKNSGILLATMLMDAAWMQMLICVHFKKRLRTE